MKAFHGRGHDGSFDRLAMLRQNTNPEVNALANWDGSNCVTACHT